MFKIEIVKKGIVFSNDIYTILKGKNAVDFSYENAGLHIPTEDEIQIVRQDFAKDVNRIFENEATIYSEEEMKSFMFESFESDDDGYPIVSLDKIYYDSDEKNCISYYLDCTRLEGEKELVSRKRPDDKNNVEQQIKSISQELQGKGVNEVILVDDVVFTGDALRRISQLFDKYSIEVIGIRSAISSKDGFDYFNRCLRKGLRCGCMLGEDVIDQICERDFYFGIAQSGISVKTPSGKILKAPYFKPFGNPERRASIPSEYVDFFSNGCLMRSMFLWKQMEDRSGREIYVRDLPEQIVKTKNDDRVLEVLKKGLVYDEKDTNRSDGVSR